MSVKEQHKRGERKDGWVLFAQRKIPCIIRLKGVIAWPRSSEGVTRCNNNMPKHEGSVPSVDSLFPVRMNGFIVLQTGSLIAQGQRVLANKIGHFRFLDRYCVLVTH